jgi:hypothetical protein
MMFEGSILMHVDWRYHVLLHSAPSLMIIVIIFWIQYIVKNSVSSLDMANEEPRIGHLDACTLNDSASIPKLAYSVAVLWTSVVAICNSPWSIVWFSGSSATVL